MKVWIRHQNGIVEDLGKATESEAIEIFRNHDWDAEIKDYDPDKDGPDHCLPAFGLVGERHTSCDISPFDESFCKVNLYFHRPATFFGLFAINQDVWKHLPKYRRDSVSQVVKLFYAKDIDGLCKLIQREKDQL